jgi:hypothetical protein
MEIANSPAIAVASPEPTISEPISPELVLVDPELRRALLAQAAREAQAELERARLQLVPDVEPPPPEPTPEPEPLAPPTLVPVAQPPAAGSRPMSLPPLAPRPPAWPRRYLVPVLLPLSLALNAILITLAWSDATLSPEPTSAPTALNVTLPRNGGQKPAGSPGKGGAKPTAAKGTAQRPRNAALERKLLNLIVQAPAGKLPRALINSKTGLAKNGLQAVCRRGNGRSFLCVVRPAKHKPGEGLYARYRVNRKGNGGTFTWYRYRNG